jgi:hypothetical protein
METHKEDPQPNQPHKEPKPRKRRFRIVKLEERIAPSKGSTHQLSCDTHCGVCTK